jgi:hypothetical protein
MMLLALAGAVAVTVNSVPVRSDAPPIVQRGRVLLPARAVFQALGAEVDYDPATGHVDIRRGTRFVRVTAGSNRALIGTQSITLDVAAQIHDGRTYLPLRFVAESLGGMVDYNDSTRTVSIVDPDAPDGRQANVTPPQGNYPPPQTTYAPPPQQPYVAYSAPTVENRHPAPGERIGSSFPTISASIFTHGGPPVDPGSVRMFLDGRDVTDRIYRSGDDVGFTPSQEVLAGPHQVTLQGRHAVHLELGFPEHVYVLEPAVVSVGTGLRRLPVRIATLRRARVPIRQHRGDPVDRTAGRARLRHAVRLRFELSAAVRTRAQPLLHDDHAAG